MRLSSEGLKFPCGESLRGARGGDPRVSLSWISEFLTDDDLGKGFSMTEEEDCITVYRWGKVIAQFFTAGVTLEALRGFLEQEKGGDK